MSLSTTPPPTTLPPYLYFNNTFNNEVDLKKAEILLYYKQNGAIAYKYTGFPGPTDNDIQKDFSASQSNIIVDNISSNFYPLSMTIWGKQYDGTNNTFRMVEINSNDTNVTTFEVKNNSISLSISLGGKVLSSSNIKNFGVNDTVKYLTTSTNNPSLIAKFIILFDVQSNQSMIKNTNTKEMFKYIGVI
jgi:hypothetical protein